MRHHTKDPAERAADIADREAEKEWKRTGPYGSGYEKVWLETYHQALRELTLSSEKIPAA